MFWWIVGIWGALVAGTVAGMAICGMLTAAKVADLHSELDEARHAIDGLRDYVRDSAKEKHETVARQIRRTAWGA